LPQVPFRISPMLATLVTEPFDRRNWIFEEKYDGVRMLAYKEGRRVSLISRNGIDRTDRYLEIANAVQHLKPETLLLDGEVVVFDAHNVSRFQLLQQGKGTPEYAVFDCLYFDGKDLRREPLANRRKSLESLKGFSGRLRVSAKLARNGIDAFSLASRRGFEGIVCKNLASLYQSRRSREWLKVKVHHEQEFVIGGFTRPKGSRIEFGALLLGVYQRSALQYVGKVGTGFDENTLRELHKKFRPLLRTSSPFVDPRPERDATFLQPKLIAQIAFTEWTSDNKLRHPVYLGLRDDKSPKAVRREE